MEDDAAMEVEGPVSKGGHQGEYELDESSEFVIPSSFASLADGDGGDFSVDEILDVAGMTLNKQKGMMKRLEGALESNTLQIADPDIFYQFYSAVHGWSALPAALQTEVVDILSQGLKKLLFYLNDGISLNEPRNALKMYCTLLGEVAMQAATAKKGKKRKEAKIPDIVEAVLASLLEIVRCPEQQLLWNTMEGRHSLNQVSRLLFRTCSKVFENPILLKTKALKQIFNALFVESVTIYEMHELATGFFIQSALKVEHSSVPDLLVDLIGSFSIVSDTAMNQIVESIFHDVGKLDAKDLSRDANASKALGSFLTHLAASVPTVTLMNLSILSVILSTDNYLLRNAVMQVYTKILLHLHGQEEEEGSSKKKIEEALMAELMQRTQDINSYCRSKALQMWSELCESQAIPATLWSHVATVTAERLQDKALQVRKNAIALLTGLLQRNPFGPRLALSMFDERYTALSAKEEKTEAETIEIEYTLEAARFIRAIDGVMGAVVGLVAVSSTMALECIRLIKVCNEFGLEKAGEPMIQLLALMRLAADKDGAEASKAAVVGAYYDVFILPGERSNNPSLVALKLILVLESLTHVQTQSFEQLIVALTKKGKVSKPVIATWWGIFSSEESDAKSAVALDLIRMVSIAKPQVIGNNLALLLKRTFHSGSNDLHQTTCRALQTLDPSKVQEHDLLHEINARMSDIILCKNKAAVSWFRAAEQAVNVVFHLNENAVAMCTNVLLNWAGQCGLLVQEQKEATPCPAGLLAQFFFVLGHVALKCLSKVQHVEAEIKRKKRQVQPGMEAKVEEEFGFSGYDDYEIEMLREQAENSIVGPGHVIGVFAPLLRHVISNPSKYSDVSLQRAATLSLVKMMAVSGNFCNDHLQLLFSALEQAKDEEIRSNIMIGLADLMVRFPNLVDPWSPYMFARLQDSSVGVRKCSLMVITHLMLSDMVKVKTDFSDILVLVLDDEPVIQQLARQFFVELSKKPNNLIYNLLPQTVSRLVQSDQVDEKQFQEMVRYLTQFIDKERQAEGLVDKFCQRIGAVHDPVEARQIVFCVHQLPITGDKSITKFVSSFKAFKDKLLDEPFYKELHVATQKMRKNPKQEIRDLLDHFEQQLDRCRSAGEDGDVDTPMEAMPVQSQKPKAKKPAAPKKQPVRQSRRSRKKVVSSSEEEDLELESDSE